MSAARTAEAPKAEEAPRDPTRELGELHRQVQQRIALLLYGRSHDGIYAPLTQRFHRVQRGVLDNGTVSRTPAAQRAALEADLRELLDAPEDVLRRMVFHKATSARCQPPGAAETLRNIAAAETERQQREAMRPKLSPAELVQHFASRGITIEAGADGNLHVRPANLLSDADRRVLAEQKPSVLAVVSAAAETTVI